MGSALQQEPLSPIDQRATLSQDAATTTQLATNPTVDSKLMNSSKQGGTAMPSQQIAVTVTNNAVASAVLNSMQEPMKEPVGVSAAANGEKAPETPVIKLDATPAVTEPFSVAVPVTVKTPDQAITANRPVANSIEALLQQDLVSLQVSSVTPTNPTLTKAPQVNITQNSATTNDSTADAKSEAAAGATEEVVITAVEPMQEETGLPEKTLGHSEKDPLVKTANKSELNVMAPTLFNSVLKSVDPVQVAATATASPRQELHDVARQVLNGMSLSTDQLKSSQVIITLKPEHLGEVTVKINVDGDKVTAAFHAASSEVRAILESSLPQLRQEMSHQGWKFDSDGVYGGMKEPFSNQQQQQQQPTPEQQIPLFTNRVQRDVYNDVGDFTVSARTQVMSSAAVDYRI
jgi:flagellar hook-length control protein FliK